MPASITRPPERRSTRAVIKQSLVDGTTASQNLFNQLPVPVLLLTLPQLLAHPPTHPLHVPSLRSSFCAVKRAIDLSSTAVLGDVFTPELECRAWTMLAEIGLQLAEVSSPRDTSWDEEVRHVRVQTHYPLTTRNRYRLL